MTVTDQSAGNAPTSFTVEGEEVTIPVEVRSARMVVGQWLVDADAAQAVIGYSGLRIARQLGGRAMCSISAVQYLDNDLGPYHEIAVAFVVHPHDRPDAKPSMTAPVTFIHRLPVNQSFTCAAGKGIWGFPKWICDISYVDRPGRTEAVLLDDGDFVLGLSVRHSPVPLPSQELEMACYSWDDGVLRRTPWTTRNGLAHARPGGATLELGSRHPLAVELRSIGLPKRALMTMSAGLLTATFGAPEVVDPSTMR